MKLSLLAIIAALPGCALLGSTTSSLGGAPAPSSDTENAHGPVAYQPAGDTPEAAAPTASATAPLVFSKTKTSKPVTEIKVKDAVWLRAALAGAPAALLAAKAPCDKGALLTLDYVTDAYKEDGGSFSMVKMTPAQASSTELLVQLNGNSQLPTLEYDFREHLAKQLPAGKTDVDLRVIANCRAADVLYDGGYVHVELARGTLTVMK
jgi:hypothetical protein